MTEPRIFTGRNISVSQVEELRRFAVGLAPVLSESEGVDRGPRGVYVNRPRMMPGRNVSGWSGFIQYPAGTFLEASPALNVGDGWESSIDGVYLKVKYSDGTITYSDEIADAPADYDDFYYAYVADKIGSGESEVYRLSPRTTGDIIIAFRPYRCVS